MRRLVLLMFYLISVFNLYSEENLSSEDLILKANLGDVPSMALLGKHYAWGLGVEKDDVKSFQWTMKAGLKDHAPSQSFLGDMYHDGMGVERDLGESFYWYQKSAEQNEDIASLAYCYRFGDGTNKDIDKAILLYKKAIANGEFEANLYLGELYLREENFKDLKQASHWIKIVKNTDETFLEEQNILWFKERTIDYWNGYQLWRYETP